MIDYIENNIRTRITLENISDATFVSKYHLHRIFGSLANIPLMEYIRKRRLSLSIYELLNTNMKIVDIALYYGFDYEQSYIRSFTNLFHISPRQLRSNGSPVKIVDKLDLNLIKAIESGILLQPSIIIKPEFFTVGVKHEVLQDDNLINDTANKVALDFFYNQRMRILNAKNPNVLIGLSRYAHISANESTYLPSIEVYDLSNIPSGMCGDTIPSHKYAVFKYIGLHSPNHITLNTLLCIYNNVFDWIAHSTYKIADNFHFESIDAGVCKDDYCEVEVFIPIK